MLDEKKCPDCGVVKTASEYSKDKSKKTGLATYCKACYSVRSKSYYKDNSKVIKSRSAEYYRNNKLAHKENGERWRRENKEKLTAWRKMYHKRRYVSGDGYALGHVVRGMMSRGLRATKKPKDFVTFEKIGYTTDQLRSRIECQFSPGMCWDNYGEWEIDHKIPVMIMIKRGETRPEKINMLSNLQPIWKHKNRSKGARYVG